MQWTWVVTWIFEFLARDFGQQISKSLSDHIVSDFLSLDVSCRRLFNGGRGALVELHNVLQHADGLVERAILVVLGESILLQIIILQESNTAHIEWVDVASEATWQSQGQSCQIQQGHLFRQAARFH